MDKPRRSEDEKLSPDYRSILVGAVENAPYGFDIVDEDGKFVYVNDSYVRMWGYESREDVLVTRPTAHCADKTIPSKIIAGLQEHGVAEIEFQAKRKDGTLFDVLMYAHLGHTSDGFELYYGTSIDITEHNERLTAVEELSNQKTALLRELHHRTKNSIQLILSMLRIRAEKYADGTVSQRLLDDIESRIIAMAMVHDRVYEMDDLTNIDLGSYIHDLAEYLVSGRERPGTMIDVDYATEKIVVPVDTAISCGLIVNELVNNALDHAFNDIGVDAGNRRIEVVVGEGDAGETVLVSVSDNGDGASDDFSLDRFSSIGLLTARSLAEGQLKGQMEVLEGRGFGIRFSFRREVR